MIEKYQLAIVQEVSWKELRAVFMLLIELTPLSTVDDTDEVIGVSTYNPDESPVRKVLTAVI